MPFYTITISTWMKRRDSTMAVFGSRSQYRNETFSPLINHYCILSILVERKYIMVFNQVDECDHWLLIMLFTSWLSWRCTALVYFCCVIVVIVKSHCVVQLDQRYSVASGGWSSSLVAWAAHWAYTPAILTVTLAFLSLKLAVLTVTPTILTGHQLSWLDTSHPDWTQAVLTVTLVVLTATLVVLTGTPAVLTVTLAVLAGTLVAILTLAFLATATFPLA